MEIIGMPDSIVTLCKRVTFNLPDIDYDSLQQPYDCVEFLWDYFEGPLPEGSEEDSIFKGANGELECASGLYNRLRKDDCYLFQSLMLSHGKTHTRPDHVLLHPNVLAIIDSKNLYPANYMHTLQDRLKECFDELIFRRDLLRDIFQKTGETIDWRLAMFVPTDCTRNPYAYYKNEKIWLAKDPDQLVSMLVGCGPASYSPRQLSMFKDVLDCVDRYDLEHIRRYKWS